MKVSEKYNKIIYTIEELAQGRKVDNTIISIPNHEISDKAFNIAECSTMNDQSKNVLFLFLNNSTVIDYINERKMVAVYKMLIDCEDWTKEIIYNAIQLLGLSDYQAFCKKFKKYFDISPKKAFLCKKSAVLPVVRDWDAISKDGSSSYVKFDEINKMDEKFGISKEKFMLAYVAANLQSFYKLNDYESEVAFKLSETNNLSIENTFEYVYNYVWDFIDDETSKRDQRLEVDLLNPEVIYMYFECAMSFNEIIIVLIAMKKNKLPRELKDTDRLYLLGFKKFTDRKFLNAEINLFNGLIDENSYEDIYNYYISESNSRDSDKVYLRFVENCASSSFRTALNMAEFMSDEIVMSYDFVNEYEEELEEDYEQDEFINDHDLDDIETIQEFFVNHDHLEKINISRSIADSLDFSFCEFNNYCDMLDSDEKKVENPQINRKLMGYDNLDIDEIIKVRN